MRTTACPALAAAIVIVLGTGCTREANERLELGADIEIPALQPRTAELPTGTPSVVGFDRSNWEPMIYVVPVNGVAHAPAYAPPTFVKDASARERGEYPTALTSLDLDKDDEEAEIGQMFASHGQAALDALLLVPRAIIRTPCATDWSPRWSYARASAPVVSTPPELGEADVTEPDAEPLAEPAPEVGPVE